MSSPLKAKSEPSSNVDSSSPEGPSDKSKSTSKIPKPKASSTKDRPKSSPKLHALGKVPAYLLRLRPKSSSSKDSSKKKVECPPNEGTTLTDSGNVEANQNLTTNQDEDVEVVIKTTNLEGDVPFDETISKKKREVIDELNQYFETNGISPVSETELTIAKLRRELAKSSATLVENRRLSLKIEALERQLDREEQLVKEKDLKILKLQQESLGLSDRVREQRKSMTSLQQHLAAKDRLLAEKDLEISKFKAAERDSMNLKEQENTQTENENTKSELIVPSEVVNSEDALEEIRKKMINMITACKEKFKFTRLEEENRHELQNFNEIFAKMAEKQRQCFQKEEKIKNMITNNQRLKSHRTKLYKVLKQLEEENRKLCRMVPSNEPETYQIFQEPISSEENTEILQNASTDNDYFET